MSPYQDIPDENRADPSDQYPASLYFHCPHTNCDGHVKLRDRSQHHAVRCEKCGLDFAIGADPELATGETRALSPPTRRTCLLTCIVVDSATPGGCVISVTANTLGHYQAPQKPGAGGRREVYRARYATCPAQAGSYRCLGRHFSGSQQQPSANSRPTRYP